VSRTNLSRHRWSQATHYLVHVDQTRRNKPASNPTRWIPSSNCHTPFISRTIDLTAPPPPRHPSRHPPPVQSAVLRGPVPSTTATPLATTTAGEGHRFRNPNRSRYGNPSLLTSNHVVLAVNNDRRPAVRLHPPADGSGVAFSSSREPPGRSRVEPWASKEERGIVASLNITTNGVGFEGGTVTSILPGLDLRGVG
jgi:hypothetical protein